MKRRRTWKPMSLKKTWNLSWLSCSNSETVLADSWVIPGRGTRPAVLGVKQTLELVAILRSCRAVESCKSLGSSGCWGCRSLARSCNGDGSWQLRGRKAADGRTGRMCVDVNILTELTAGCHVDGGGVEGDWRRYCPGPRELAVSSLAAAPADQRCIDCGARRRGNWGRGRDALADQGTGRSAHTSDFLSNGNPQCAIVRPTWRPPARPPAHLCVRW